MGRLPIKASPIFCKGNTRSFTSALIKVFIERTWINCVYEGHRVFDFQTHVFPKECVRLIERSKSPIRVGRSSNGELFLAEQGRDQGFNFLPRFLYDGFEKRMKVVGRSGVDVQVLSVPAPGVDRFGPRLARKLARTINDSIAELSDKYPDSVTGLASVPFSDVPVAVEEVRRAVKEKGLKGIEAFTNVNGKYLDSPEFYPIYEEAVRLGVPIYVHPTVPNIAPVVGSEYNVSLLYAWPFDTTVSMTRLAFSSVLRKHPKLELVFTHGGGMVPFYNMRVRTLNAAYGKDLGGLRSKEPSFENLRKINVDLAVHYAPAMLCAISFFSTQRCVFATDFPYGRRDGSELLELSMKAVAELNIDDDGKDKILGGNASKMLRV